MTQAPMPYAAPCALSFFFWVLKPQPITLIERTPSLPPVGFPFGDCPHIQLGARGPPPETPNQFLGIIQVVFQERPPQNNLRILKKMESFSGGVLKAGKIWDWKTL